VEGKPREAKVVPNRNPRPVVTLGRSTIIRCWAVGIPRPAITWWRGTKMLPLSSKKYEQKRDMSLRITVITLRDLGPYTCQAYNGQGRATSNTVTLLAMGPVRVNTEKDREYLKYIVEPRAGTPAPVEPRPSPQPDPRPTRP
ncbi:Immunoglobulin I-set, partial [Trinorchestia longiramus]